MRSPHATVLVLRFSALGDVALTAPALHALKAAWPRARVLFATHERLAPLMRHNPHVDEVLALRPGEGVLSLAARARARGAEAVLDLHGKLRSALLRALLPTLRWASWAKRPAGQTLATRLLFRRALARRTIASRYHAGVEALVGRALPPGELRTFAGPDDLAQGEEALKRAGLSPGQPLVVVSPGAAWASKRWPPPHFAALARRALQAGLFVAVQGGPGEEALVREVLAGAPGAAGLSGLELPALMGVLARATAFAGNDSGPLHLARGLLVPSLALFGSTDPALFEMAGHRALALGLPCSPCSFHGRPDCPLGHLRCLRDLPVDAAWDALQALLRGGRPLPVHG